MRASRKVVVRGPLIRGAIADLANKRGVMAMRRVRSLVLGTQGQRGRRGPGSADGWIPVSELFQSPRLSGLALFRDG